MPGGVLDVVERAGPAASLVADPAVFHIPRGYAGAREGGAHMAGVLQVVGGFPEAAVNVDHHGMGAQAGWHAQVAELHGVRSIVDPRIGRGRGQIENIRHRPRGAASTLVKNRSMASAEDTSCATWTWPAGSLWNTVMP